MKRFDSLLFLGLVLLSCHKEKQPAEVTGVPRPTSAPVVAESQPMAEPPVSQPAAAVSPVEPAPEPVAPASAPVEPTPPVATEVAPSVPAPKPKPLDVYDALLKAYVSGGKVDYAGFKKDRAQLNDFLDFVAKASSSQKLAFWINAYNATVIAALLDSSLPAKVTDVSGFFDAKKYTFAGKKMTLNDLESKIRTDYKDPRVHFALNCGARSCPPLLAKAFRDSTLEKTLTDLTSKFLNGTGIKVDDAKKELQVTKLMDWYGEDFKVKAGSVEAYLKTWATESTRKAALSSGDYQITFQSYDWSINKK